MDDLAGRLQRHQGIGLKRSHKAWTVEVPKPPDYLFRLTVPFGDLHWYAEALPVNAGGTIWSEWNEYQPLGDDTPEDLATAMVDDVELFISRLMLLDVREAEEDGAAVLQWNLDGVWQAIRLP
jgi:hypothetical protein